MNLYEVPVSKQEIKWSCICVLGISIFTLFHRFRTVLTVWYIFFVFIYSWHTSSTIYLISAIFISIIGSIKKSLKIPKGQSESVYRRRTDNTMAKRKRTKDKQRSTKHTHKTKDRVTRTPLRTEGEPRCSGRASSSCYTSGTHYANLDTNPVISDGWGKDWEVFCYKWNISVVICDTDLS